MRVVAALTGSHSGGAVAEILSSIRVAKRTAARHLRASGLPTPGAWRSYSRAVRGVLALQRSRSLSMERVALGHGFSDAAGFEHLSERVFARTLGYTRRELGWQPLLRLFLNRRSGPASQFT
jgi:transcriptional regulator GlxA family with amidase domain